jgi:hypothetical protein
MTNWQRDEREYWPDHIEIPENDWLFTKEQLADSVSVRAGLSKKDELAKMEKMYRFMREIGSHEPVMFFAVIYLQRYFQRVPVTQGNPYHICVVMIFLASRVLEQHRPGPDLALKGAKVALGNQQISKQSKDFWIWRDELVKNEMLVMDKLCCDFILYNPWEELKRILVKNKNSEYEINQVDQDVGNFWKSMHQEVPLPAHALRLMGRIAHTQVYLVFRIQDVMIAMLIASTIHYKLKWPKHFFKTRGIRVNIATSMKIYKFIHREQNVEMRKSDYEGFNFSQDEIKGACYEDFEGFDDALDSGVSSPPKSKIETSDDLANTLSFTGVSQEPRDTPFKIVAKSSTVGTPSSMNEQTVKSKDVVQAYISPKGTLQKDHMKTNGISNPTEKSSDAPLEDESEPTTRESNNRGQTSAQLEAKDTTEIIGESKDQVATAQQDVANNIKNETSVHLIRLGNSDEKETVGQLLDDISAESGATTIDKDHDVMTKANCEEKGKFLAKDSSEVPMETRQAKNIPSEVKEEHKDVKNDREPYLNTGMQTPNFNASSSGWKPASSHSLKAVQAIPHLIAPLPKMKEKSKEITSNPARGQIESLGSIKKSKRTGSTLSERPQFDKPSAENPLVEKSPFHGSAVEENSGQSLNSQSPSAENSRGPQNSSFEKRKRLHSDIQDLERRKKSNTERQCSSLDSTTLERIIEPDINKPQISNGISLDSTKNTMSQSQSVAQKIREKAANGSSTKTKTGGVNKGTNVAVPAVPDDVAKVNKVKKRQLSAEQERKRRLETLIDHIDKLDGQLDDLK